MHPQIHCDVIAAHVLALNPLNPPGICYRSYFHTSKLIGFLHIVAWHMNHHIKNISQSIYRSINFLHRNISKCSADTKHMGITGMVIPKLEYASSACDPHQQNHIQKLKLIHSKAARFLLNRYNPLINVTQMRQELGLSTLQARRLTARMTMCHKAVDGLVHLPFPDYLTPKSRTMRGENTHQYTVVHTRTDVFKYCFFPMTIRCWNILPVTLIK